MPDIGSKRRNNLLENNQMQQQAAEDLLDQPRRGFFRRYIAIIAVAALGGVACTQVSQTSKLTPTTLDSHVASTVAVKGKLYNPVFFHPAEFVFVTAAVARLIPADDTGHGAIEAGVPEFIDRQMEGPFGHAATWYTHGPFIGSPAEFDYQGKLSPREVYRAAIAAIDTQCKKHFAGKTFAQLEVAEQDKLLKALESGALPLHGNIGKAFFGFLLQNTKEGYLSDPIHGGNKDGGSWKMIGFPRERADFIDWVGRQGEKYPLPPVSIHSPES